MGIFVGLKEGRRVRLGDIDTEGEFVEGLILGRSLGLFEG